MASEQTREHIQERRVSFVVRMADGPFRERDAWRGEVEHVSLQKKRSFQGQNHLLQVLEELAALED